MSRPSTSSGLPGPVARLPSEVLSIILAELEDPLDVYHASLTSRAWRGTAVDPRLWEEHYWRFYRGSGSSKGEQHDRLVQRREQKHHLAMRGWYKKASSSSLHPDWLRPFLVRHSPSGEASLYAPLARGMLRVVSTQGGTSGAVVECAFDFMKRERAERGNMDPEEPTPRLLQHLQQTLGTTPSAADDEYAAARIESFSREVIRLANLAPPLVSLPPFLQRTAAATPLPDFHALFVSRMNSDEQLLNEISSHTALSTGRLDDLLRLVDRYGDGARDLLAALAADQQITEETVQVFVEGANDAAELRALGVHSRSATAAPRPLRANCIALNYAAKQMLGHLQRREAVRSMRELRRRWKLGPQLERMVSTRRQRILESCKGVEDALCDLALFRGGEKTEVKAYLDHLALFVWANIEAQRKSSQAATSTRQLMSNIWSNLRTLGFGIASGENFFHNSNSFINVVLCCPGQRESIPLTLMAIVCAVARRLGVAASLINTPSVVMGVVVEDAQEPESWSGDDASKEWSRFFAYPSVEEDQFIVELGGFKRFFSLQAAQADRINSYMEPASPAVILERAARNLLNAGQESPQLMQTDERAATSSTPGQRPAEDPLGALGDYLSGRQATPPSPLSPALLRSSLSSLPPTHSHAQRDNPYTARQDADYASAWIFRAISPELMARGPDNWLIEAFLNESVNDAPYQCDVTLLLEVNGCDVEWEMRWARRRAVRGGGEEEGESGSDGESDDERGYSEQPRASAQLRSFIAKTLRSDKMPYNGAGGFTVERDAAALRLNDELQPPNARIRYAIGTVFHHRVHDYYGVVLGRASGCQASEGWIRQMRVDALPSGGRHQPFYNVVVGHDESSRYVAQCNIEPVQLPVDAMEALRILRELVPLFNLRAVGKHFRTVEIVAPGAVGAAGEEDDGRQEVREASPGGEGDERGRGAAGEVRLVMNAWLREAWPHD